MLTAETIAVLKFVCTIVLLVVAIVFLRLLKIVQGISEAVRRDEGAKLIWCHGCDRVYYDGQAGNPKCDSCQKRGR